MATVIEHPESHFIRVRESLRVPLLWLLREGWLGWRLK